MDMRKLFFGIVAATMLFAVAAWASDSSMSGWIVDSKCGAHAAHAGNEACTKKCLEAGAKPVFVSDNKKEVLNLNNPDAVKGHEGHHVKVTGTVSDGVLHVDSLEMADSDSGAAEHQH
jgi:SpoU rRNA methylase family enzyme